MTNLPNPITQALAPFAPADSDVAREAAAIAADVRANRTKVERADARKYAVGMAYQTNPGSAFKSFRGMGTW